MGVASFTSLKWRSVNHFCSYRFNDALNIVLDSNYVKGCRAFSFCLLWISAFTLDVARLCVTQVFQLAAPSGLVSTGHVHPKPPVAAAGVMDADRGVNAYHSLFSAASRQVLLVTNTNGKRLLKGAFLMMLLILSFISW